MEPSFEPGIDLQERAKSVTLGEFALLQHITEDRVWEMLEEGQLSARFVNDAILIFRDSTELETKSQSLKSCSEKSVLREPAIDAPTGLPSDFDFSASDSEVEGSLGDSRLNSPNHTRALELAESLLKAKDELLALKDEKIAFIDKQLAAQEVEIRRLRREVENYQTLCKISKNPESLRKLVAET